MAILLGGVKFASVTSVLLVVLLFSAAESRALLHLSSRGSELQRRGRQLFGDRLSRVSNPAPAANLFKIRWVPPPETQVPEPGVPERYPPPPEEKSPLEGNPSLAPTDCDNNQSGVSCARSSPPAISRRFTGAKQKT